MEVASDCGCCAETSSSRALREIAFVAVATALQNLLRRAN
jgi:hypothetical protein